MTFFSFNSGAELFSPAAIVSWGKFFSSLLILTEADAYAYHDMFEDYGILALSIAQLGGET